MISMREFRRRYPMFKKLANGKRIRTNHKVFLDEFSEAKTENERHAAVEKYLGLSSGKQTKK